MKPSAFALLLLLAACSTPNDPGDGGVTLREAEELNAVAAALDASNDSVPSVANTPIPVVPSPPADPELDKPAE